MKNKSFAYNLYYYKIQIFLCGMDGEHIDGNNKVVVVVVVVL